MFFNINFFWIYIVHNAPKWRYASLNICLTQRHWFKRLLHLLIAVVVLWPSQTFTKHLCSIIKIQHSNALLTTIKFSCSSSENEMKCCKKNVLVLKLWFSHARDNEWEMFVCLMLTLHSFCVTQDKQNRSHSMVV